MADLNPYIMAIIEDSSGDGIAQVPMLQIPDAGETLYLSIENAAEPIRQRYRVTERRWQYVVTKEGTPHQCCVLVVESIE
jgi:hypothetical protein